MALFGSGNDASLLRHLNRELVNKWVDMECALYKLDHSNTDSNIYNEAPNKYYENPVRLKALIEFEDKDYQSDEVGITANREATFSFIKDDLVGGGVFIEIGDILWFDGEYFEVNQLDSSKYWGGRNPENDIGQRLDGAKEHGYDVHVRIKAHLSSVTTLNLVSERRGGESAVKTQGNDVRNIYD